MVNLPDCEIFILKNPQKNIKPNTNQISISLHRTASATKVIILQFLKLNLNHS